MGLLLQAPNNKKMLALQSQLMEAHQLALRKAFLHCFNSILQLWPCSTFGPRAWGNPIMFVPGGGLSGVWLGYRSGDVTSPANYDNANATVASPDKRSFWVSAGPDGNFRTGDDNVIRPGLSRMKMQGTKAQRHAGTQGMNSSLRAFVPPCLRAFLPLCPSSPQLHPHRNHSSSWA